MGNVCRTIYKIEGPEDEVQCLLKHLQWIEKVRVSREEQQNDSMEREKQDKPWKEMTHRERVLAELNSERRILRKSRELSAKEKLYGPEYALTYYYHILTNLTQDCIQPMNDGWAVLSVESMSEWTPWNNIWESMMSRFATHACYYYYAEEFGCDVVETNDIHHKYFSFDYAVIADFSEDSPEDLKDVFSRKDGYLSCQKIRKIGASGHHALYLSYWTESKLFRTLRWLTRSRSADIDALADKLQKRLEKEPSTNIRIHAVQKKAKAQASPCRHCQELLSLQEELENKDEQIERLKLLVKHLYCRTH